MNIRLFSDYVLINPTPAEEQTPGGIFLVKSETESAPTTGKVIAFGPGRYDSGTFIKITVKHSDKVMWHKFAGTKVVIDGATYLLMHEFDLTCIIGS